MHIHPSAQSATPAGGQAAVNHVKTAAAAIRKPPAFAPRRPLGHRPTASTGSLSLASNTSGTTLADDPFAYPYPSTSSNSSNSPSPKKKSSVLTPLYLPNRALSSVIVPPSPRSLRSVHSHRLASALTTPPRTRTTKRAPPTPAVLSMPSTEPIAMLSPPTQHQHQQRPSLSPHHSRRSSLTPNPNYDRNTRSSVDSRRPSVTPLSRPGSPEVHREGGRTASRSERLLRDTLRRDERARSQSRVRSRSGSDASMDFPRTNSIGEVSAYIAAPTPSHGHAPFMSVPPSPKFTRSHTSQTLATPPTHAHAHHNQHPHHQLHLHTHTPSRPHLAHSPATSPPGALPTGVGLGISPTLAGPMARRTRSPTVPRELNFGPGLNGMTALHAGLVHGHVGCTCASASGPTRATRASRRDSRQSVGSGSGPHSRQNSSADMTASPKVSGGAPLTPPPTPPHTAQRLPHGVPGQLQRRGTGASRASRASSVDLRLSPSASGSSGSGASSPSMHSPTCPMHSTSPLEQVLAAPFEMAASAPPTPRFDVQQAALQCAAKTGYIAFGEVDGLGVPGSLDEESEREANNQGSEARRGRTGMGKGLAKVLAWWHAPVGQGQGPARVL